MADASPFHVEPLRLDADNECVWRGAQSIQLTPTAFALVRNLVERPGQLVTKDELLTAVWPEVVVSENALTTHVGVIRQALDDNAKTPHYIETIHRRGYRFIGKVVRSQHSGVSSPFSSLAPITQYLAPALVGRETELTQLHKWLEKALAGERQLVFVTGEAGIGKTTVVEAFLTRIRDQRTGNGEPNPPQLIPVPRTSISRLWFSHGECIEHFGAGEAYLPVLAALGQLGREAHDQHFVEMLDQYAPTWLVQMPALVKPTDFEVLQCRTAGATRTRMLREMAEALEVLTNEQPLVLVLEDLHWSDPSTLELLSFVARRRQSARLLVLGTYRPVEVLANEHPLRAVTQELQLHRQSEELPFGFLTEEQVAEYLETRMSRTHDYAPLQRLAYSIHRRTEGNPLFMVNIVDALLIQSPLDSQQIESRTPTTIRQMIERQFDHLSPQEQEVLAVASAAGVEFSLAAVAAVMGATVTELETLCTQLARRGQFLQASGTLEWPDGTVAMRCRFLHALYQEVLYERVTPARCIELHHHIGERLERAYGTHATEIAAELAVHFERGHEYHHAIRYLQQSAQNAIQRSANAEAISQLTKGLDLLKTLPDTPERTLREFDLQTVLGMVLMATKGYAAPEVANAYARARELSRGVEEAPRLSSLFYGLWVFHLVRGEVMTAYEVAQQFMHLAQNVQDPALLMEAHHAFGQILHFMGDFPSALAHLEQNLALYNPQQHSPAVRRNVQDLGVMGLCYAAWSLWYLGYPDQALKRSDKALALAREISHPFSLAFALSVAASIRLHRQELQIAQEWAEALLTFATEQGYPLLVMTGTVYRGQALAEQGDRERGIAQLRRGLAAYRATGGKLGQPRVLSALGKAYGKIGRPGEGLSLLAEALMITDKGGDRRDEAELYHLKGELTLQQANQKAKGKSY